MKKIITALLTMLLFLSLSLNIRQYLTKKEFFEQDICSQFDELIIHQTNQEFFDTIVVNNINYIDVMTALYDFDDNILYPYYYGKE